MQTPDNSSPKDSKRASSQAESAFHDMAIRLGWSISKKGWPDFFLSFEGRPFCVEIKPKGNRRLRKDQQVVMETLATIGLPCYRWSPDGGFEPVGASPSFEDFKAGKTLPAPSGGERGGSSCSSLEQKELPTSNLLEGGSGGKPFTSQIDEVWGHFVKTMKPRQTLASEEERGLIRKALKVATAEECKRAIDACEASDYHMKRGQYANRKGGRYNKLSHILKGRYGKETTRERIDWWLDRAGERTFPSADPAIVAQHQLEVQRGHRFSDNPEMVERAARSEVWLMEHGIETVRREDGYPTFNPVKDGA